MTPKDEDADYWMRQFTESKQAEFRLRIQLEAKDAKIASLLKSVAAWERGAKADAAEIAALRKSY